MKGRKTVTFLCAAAYNDSERPPRTMRRGRSGRLRMEISFKEMRNKFVVNMSDGRNLGRPSDLLFTYPEGRVLGIAVPGRRGWRPFRNNDLFISLRSIVKIGADVVLVDLKNARPDSGGGGKKRDEFCDYPTGGRRDFGEYE